MSRGIRSCSLGLILSTAGLLAAHQAELQRPARDASLNMCRLTLCALLTWCLRPLLCRRG